MEYRLAEEAVQRLDLAARAADQALVRASQGGDEELKAAVEDALAAIEAARRLASGDR